MPEMLASYSRLSKSKISIERFRFDKKTFSRSVFDIISVAFYDKL